ncbi:MAG TPA: FkbM family methyltransferase [Baekduia sp.]|uniref:FkbM family methyltransferase n=1 Tax=Baekduia sp. TaxID=2600305 RepID=UPI002D13D106|nr:FkbM family methyltransferase [Baekduia sp.]HMJ36422.1 FkbM family methyltransferase [Baekduia sp.]
MNNALSPRRLTYYAAAVPRMLRGFRRPLGAIGALAGATAPRPITLRDNGLRLQVRDRMDVWAVQETTLHRHYEIYGFLVGQGWSVLDIGGGLGDYALLVAHEHPDAHVVAYEPFPGSRELYERNRAANGIQGAEVRPEAIGEPGFVRYADLGRGPGEHAVAPAGPATPDAIESIALETALDRAGMPRCDLAKIDCEGAEFPILLGASDETLARIDRIVLEYHDGPGRDHGELELRLRAAGYEVQEFPSIHEGLGYMRAWRSAAGLRPSV